MAKEEYYEEEEFEEEEELEEEEDDEEDFESVIKNPRVKMLYKELDELLDERRRYEYGSEKRKQITAEIEQLSKTIDYIEESDRQRADKERSIAEQKASEIQANELEGSKFWERLRTFSALAGMFVPIGVEIVRQRHEERKVDKVTKYEQEGGIIKTQATKWIK